MAWKEAVRDKAKSAREKGDAILATLRPDVEEKNPLLEYFNTNDQRMVYKWMHYFDVYHRHLAKFRGKPVNVIEFGVSHGGSLQMWKSYFGPQARIIGVDIMEKCADFGEEQIEIMIGDQGNREFLQQVASRMGHIDVLIDDGGHRGHQQIATFEELWPIVTDGGVFLVEDLHASYWSETDGGYKRPGTFIEYAKDLIDQLNAWHSREKDKFDVDDYTRSIAGMHVYSSMIVLDKENVTKPVNRRTGRASFS